MGRCIIIGPMWEGEERAYFSPEEGDCVLCADAGMLKAVRYGIRPDLVIGDFDSMPCPGHCDIPLRILPVRKDDTDTAVCIQEGRRRGYQTFRLAGCLGGRLDHTLANLQLAADCAARGEQVWLADARNRVTVLGPGSYSIPRMEDDGVTRKLSLFAYTPTVSHIHLHGTEWELKDSSLSQLRPLGCSNWFQEGMENASLRFSEGLLILALSSD